MPAKTSTPELQIESFDRQIIWLKICAIYDCWPQLFFVPPPLSLLLLFSSSLFSNRSRSCYSVSLYASKHAAAAAAV